MYAPEALLKNIVPIFIMSRSPQQWVGDGPYDQILMTNGPRRPLARSGIVVGRGGGGNSALVSYGTRSMIAVTPQQEYPSKKGVGHCVGT